MERGPSIEGLITKKMDTDRIRQDRRRGGRSETRGSGWRMLCEAQYSVLSREMRLGVL